MFFEATIDFYADYNICENTPPPILYIFLRKIIDFLATASEPSWVQNQAHAGLFIIDT